MERNMRSCTREKGLIDLTDVVIEPPFAKEIIACPNSKKLKPLPVELYDETKDSVDHVQTFQSHIHYVGTHDAIMCHAFLTTFSLAAWN